MSATGPNTAQPDTIKKTREWPANFLAALAEAPNVAAACQAAGVGRSTAYDHRRGSPEFAAAWEAALDAGTDALVGECYRRARHGAERPVYQGGEKVGSVTEYSDTLAIFLLKAHRPEVYGDRSKVDMTTAGKPLEAGAAPITSPASFVPSPEYMAEVLKHLADHAPESLGRLGGPGDAGAGT